MSISTKRFLRWTAVAWLMGSLRLVAQGELSLLDQAQPAINTAAPTTLAIGGASQQQIAQVITPGISGSLTAVGLPVAGSGTLLLRIEDVSGGKPNGIVLAQQSIDGSTLSDFFTNPSGFRRLNFDTPLTIAAGDPFALVLSAPGAPTDSFGLLESPAGNLYPSGDGYFRTVSDPASNWSPIGPGFVDIPFQAYVIPVPEPRTWALSVIAGLSAIFKAVAHRKGAGLKATFSAMRRSSSSWLN